MTGDGRSEMPRLIDLQTIRDSAAGTLIVLEAQRQVPFDFSRIFMLHDVPIGAVRGNHAHRQQHQMLVAVAGAFEVTLEDRVGARNFTLNAPTVGLHAPPLTWVLIRSAAPHSTCLILTSELYDEADYIRDRAEFERLLRA